MSLTPATFTSTYTDTYIGVNNSTSIATTTVVITSMPTEGSFQTQSSTSDPSQLILTYLNGAGNISTSYINFANDTAQASTGDVSKPGLGSGQIAVIVFAAMTPLILIVKFYLDKRKKRKAAKVNAQAAGEAEKGGIGDEENDETTKLTGVLPRHMLDGEELRELHGDALRREVDGQPVYEMRAEPAELHEDLLLHEAGGSPVLEMHAEACELEGDGPPVVEEPPLDTEPRSP